MFLRKYVILILVSVATSEIVFPCLTPTSEKGYCMSIFECTVLQKVLGNSNPSDIEHVKNSICSDWSLRDLWVCCPTTLIVSNNTNPVLETNNTNVVLENNVITVIENKTNSIANDSAISDKKAQREYALKKLIPTRKYCGLQHTDDRFYNDTETALDEFPWLVHVLFGDEGEELNDPLEFADRCSGVLINTRYVLTNGFCARNPLKVRLGQYNTNKTISCVQNPEFPECTEPIVEIRVEEEIHRVEIETDYSYDFALFRLAERVTYTDFVRPICLPIENAGEPDNFETFILSGWGAEDQQGVVKKRLSYNLTDLEECFKLKEFPLELPLDSYTIVCLKPPENNMYVACTGDEGGALMYSYKHQWFVDSIVNKVYGDEDKVCSKDKPIDANKVTPEVIDWILETIRP
ncbi:hypothetical protein ILUMI_02185 [Ignelater luminosus]|uniref:CLIP domain-containing serine protease n=1 Tax=Ignelater luminosus TaxID=2038154 RepID=A0A8K0DP92_IGNLU|nr:hypothetical protein ILUMI_02185 [Ignelater luminosus]